MSLGIAISILLELDEQPVNSAADVIIIADAKTAEISFFMIFSLLWIIRVEVKMFCKS